MRKKNIYPIAIAALLAFTTLFSGCLGELFPKPKVGLPTSGDQSGQAPVRTGEGALLKQAEDAQRSGRKDEAIAKYKQFVQTYPKSEYADSAKAALGGLYETKGQGDEAINVYRDLVRSHPKSSFVPEIKHRLAGLYLQGGRYDDAAALLTDMLAATPKPDEQARLRILLGRAYLGKGNRSQSLDLFLKARNETSDLVDKKEADAGVKAAIASMGLDELPLAQTEYADDYPGGIVTYVLAHKLYQAQKVDEAEAQLVVFFDRFPTNEMADEAKKLLAAIQGSGQAPELKFAENFKLAAAAAPVLAEESVVDQGPVPDYKAMDIACVLPLTESGVANYGQMVLMGMKLAIKNYQPQTPGFKVNLLEYDTQGKPEVAEKIMEQAAGRPSVLAVVGPLLSKEAAQAAPMAEKLSLPMIAISQREGLTQAGNYVYRIFLTPKAQAEAVAMYTVQVLGLTQLAILYPEEPYGREMRDYFQVEAKRLGAQIVSVVSYDPKSQEFSGAVEQLSGVGKAVKASGAGRKAKVAFEAVFLPDSYNKVAMIAPQFAYHDITTIRLLGTSLWHTPKLLSSASRYAQRSVIPTAFFAGQDNPEVKRFVEAFRAQVGDRTAEPTQFEAYGYDAGRLLLALMDRRHVSTREELVKALDAMGRFRGVTGSFTFDSNGEYRNEPILLTVEGTEFKPVQ